MDLDQALPGPANLRTELLLGRLVMIGFIGVLVFRELWSVDVVRTSGSRLIVYAGTAVLAVTWIWFWSLVAASLNQWAAGLAVALMAASAAELVQVNHIGVFPFYYAVIVAGTAFKWHVSAGLVTLVTVAALVVWWPEGQTNATALQVSGITALLGGAAITVRRFIGAQVELDAARDEVRRLATVEARAALARDLHDRLGQQLTASIMQAELLVMDLRVDALDEARRHSELVLRSSRQSLDLMRGMVLDAREPELGLEITLAEQVLAASDIPCRVEGADLEMPIPTNRVLGWVVREGVTNVLRHSGATTCRITVERGPEATVLTVHDDGRGVAANAGGFGLNHMRERLAAIGGWLSLDDDPGGGCVLVAAVPQLAVIRVLVAEDQALLRGALCEILDRHPDIDVVAQCSSGVDVVERARATRPDVAVLDIEMPGLDGLAAARLLTAELPAVKVLVLTVFGRPGYLRRAVDSGALGFILKDAPPAALIDAIQRTALGQRVVDPGVAVSALHQGTSPLTAREEEVLGLSRTVPSTAALAQELHLSEGSVRNVLSTAIQKLNAHGRAQAASIAEENGWL